jgi:hypothetical protein
MDSGITSPAQLDGKTVGVGGAMFGAVSLTERIALPWYSRDQRQERKARR